MTNYNLHAIAKPTQLIFLFNYLIFIFMDKKREKEAIDLFIASTGKEPKVCGYNAIDIYEKQKAYIMGFLADFFMLMHSLLLWNSSN